MRVKRRWLGWLLAVGLLGMQVLAHALVAVPGSHPQFQLTGRIDFADPARPKLAWPGSSVSGTFTGSYLAITLDDVQGRNFYNLFIDGDFSNPMVIACTQGRQTYVLNRRLKPGSHTFLLTKRTEGEEGDTFFEGVQLAEGHTLLAPPPRPSRRIEFFGDSITSGMGNEAPDEAPDDVSAQKNQFLAYSAVTARQLGAEMHATSQSGIGVMASWFDFTMFDFFDQLSPSGNNTSVWDFSRWTPDVVVINLLQNDKWLIDVHHVLKPEPSQAQRVQAYVRFVKRIRATYPKAYVVCVLGSMDATAPGSSWPAVVSEAVRQIKAENPAEKMDTLFFEFTGFGKHPRVRHHQANADKLTAFIKQKMGWR